MNDQELLEDVMNYLKKKGADRVQCRLKKNRQYEINFDSRSINLLRTTINSLVEIKVIKNSRRSFVVSNKLDRDSLTETMNEALDFAENAVADPANDIADLQPAGEFTTGGSEPDFEKMYDSVKEFYDELRTDFKNTLLDSTHLNFIFNHSLLMNTNGVRFDVKNGFYLFNALFTSKINTRSSSFNYASYLTKNLNERLMDRADIRNLIMQSVEQVEAKKTGMKFTGEILITPHCLDMFIGLLTDNLGDRSIISGASRFIDKMDKQITDKRFSLHSMPLSERLAYNYFVTGDGFLSENSTIVDKGYLKTFLLSQYGAKKIGKPKATNEGGCYIVDAGENSLRSITGKIKKGILLCRFSGGFSGDNGDFSGVAKNSYYIEDGEIKFPVTETMISGNIFELFNKITGISKEQINFGDQIYPWISMGGVNISG